MDIKTSIKNYLTENLKAVFKTAFFISLEGTPLEFYQSI